MGARHPLPYAYAKANTLLLEDDGERLVLWAPETVGLPALSEVLRLYEVDSLEREAAGRGECWVVQDVPLLFEGDGWRQMDATLVIDAPLELRQRRVRERSGLPAADFVARDAAQLPAREKRALASAVIDNDGSEEELDRALGQVLEELGVLPLGGPAA